NTLFLKRAMASIGKKKCELCGCERDDLWKCKRCDSKYLCSLCHQECAVCRHTYCEECVGFCDCCGRPVCLDAGGLNKCKGCPKDVCNDCVGDHVCLRSPNCSSPKAFASFPSSFLAATSS